LFRAVAAVAAALWAAAASGSSGPLTVVTTTSDLKALVEAVGGDRVRVEALANPLQDPHAIDLKPGQITRLTRADLLVRIGLDHEPWLPRALRAARATPRDLDASRSVTVLDAETPRLRADRRPHVHALGNTHYWLDPENARPITARILDTLAELAPAERAAFARNRDRFLAELDARLVRWRAALAPHAGTRVVAAHDTWVYLARRFDLAVVATVEEQPGIPPSPRYLATLIERMREAGVRVILAEPAAPTAVLLRLASETGARLVTLAPSVGADAEATDYLALFDLNVRRLREALAR
jgi:ABC-type Zn uptake system ZnuABC Zn-binding protein ZnuA